MNITKRILITAVLFIGCTTRTAEISLIPRDLWELTLIKSSLEKHLTTDCAKIAAEYVCMQKLSFYPREFVRFCDTRKIIDSSQRKGIIEDFGFVNPHEECCLISRYLDFGKNQNKSLDMIWIPVSAFDNKKDMEPLNTRYGKYLGTIAHAETTVHRLDLEESIVYWKKKTDEERATQLRDKS